MLMVSQVLHICEVTLACLRRDSNPYLDERDGIRWGSVGRPAGKADRRCPAFTTKLLPAPDIDPLGLSRLHTAARIPAGGILSPSTQIILPKYSEVTGYVEYTSKAGSARTG